MIITYIQLQRPTGSDFLQWFYLIFLGSDKIPKPEMIKPINFAPFYSPGPLLDKIFIRQSTIHVYHLVQTGP